ncbi:MAG: DUF4405 domain-containing protein [Coriobacteriales bacterium]|jgi:hypothetical protein|nr:DUF4405 domain-containing protein [Coriobacteriales bacterium]
MKSSIRLTIDILAAVLYIGAANPLITGLAVHEWLGFGLIFVFVIHCAVNYDWIITTLRRRTKDANMAHLVLDALTLIMFMTVTVSGLFVSRHILPLFGWVASGYYFWNPLHAISAKLLLALLLIHVVVHARWFVRLFARRRGTDDRDDGK